MGKKIKIEEWIEKAKQIHDDKYDYSKIVYKNCDTPVCIICPEHGEFWQTPYNHVNKKCKCPKCSNVYNFSTNEWIEKARKIHGNKYDYSKVKYKNQKEKVCIICPEHGEFWQNPNNHLNGKGCPYCKGGAKLNNEIFIQKAILIHGDKYDYSKVNYVNNRTKVCIICPKHGEFWQTPADHLTGYGCQKCGGTNKLTTEQFIEKAKEVHGDKYDYSKVEYLNNRTKVCIICPKHGEFWQMPSKHLLGECCPKCKTSKLENDVMRMLDRHKIKYIHQANKKHFKWLENQKIDIFIPELSLAIECQGEQHFKNVEIWGGELGLRKRIMLDEIKKEKCLKNNIKLIYVGSDSYADKYNLLTIKEIEKILIC